jgi:heme exporter protein B
VKGVFVTLQRELWLAARHRIEWLMPPLFYLIVVTLFGLGAKPNDPQLADYAPAILWVGALLSALLSLERLFRADYEDGTLEQVFLSAQPPVLTIATKLLAHWLISGLPLALLAAPLGVQLGMHGPALPTMVIGLLLGTPLLSLIGGFAAAVGAVAPIAGALMPVLVLPMIAPSVIFGAGAARNAAAGLDPSGPLYFLGSVLILGLTLLPWAATAALRNTFD